MKRINIKKYKCKYQKYKYKKTFCNFYDSNFNARRELEIIIRRLAKLKSNKV